MINFSQMKNLKPDSASQAPKLVIVINLLSFLLSHRQEIVERALADGYEVIICTNIDVLPDSLIASGVKIYNLPNIRGKSILLSDLVFFFKLGFFLFKNKPDIVHLISPKVILYGGVLARILRAPSVLYAFSGLGVSAVQHGWVSKLRLRIMSIWYGIVVGHRNNICIFQNSSDERFISKTSSNKKLNTILLNGSGVNLTKFQPSSKSRSGPVRVLYSGRVMIEKGVQDFCDAARLLKKNNIDVSMVIVGSIDPFHNPLLSQRCLKLATDAGIITYKGYSYDVASELRDADILCFPSYYGEGFAKVLLEASASGLPIITTDHPGCRDAVIDGETGILVPVKQPEAIAVAITKLVQDSELPTKMGSKARKLAESHFSVGPIIDEHLKAYGVLMSRHDKKRY